MAAQHKPIPALYTVYVLRSTVRHTSFYIGSTPNPPRRLNQHNGLVPGGAARTARKKLRPWEMVALVSGFPSMMAALKFEYALAFFPPFSFQCLFHVFFFFFFLPRDAKRVQMGAQQPAYFDAHTALVAPRYLDTNQN